MYLQIKNKHMRLIFIILLAWVAFSTTLIAGGAPSTYFNIYLPPNNDPVQRNVALIVTAIYDETTFTITDDDADGDNDDTVTGTLSAGQSYVLYIKDNGINDDAQYASGGVLKRDGDYFIINSSKLVFASMSTDSDWQHDFVPSVNKTSLGGKFIIYAPKITSSKRDLNVFAFEDNTTITISKISSVPTTATGYTNIDIDAKTIVKQRTINRGQDIIHHFQDGRDVMETGATYMIESNKPVSVQYGALWANARDGGGYVPSSNGSSSGDLFYFAVPYQSNGEQEIRIVSWDDNNAVTLERYENGNWISMKSWDINRLKPADWIGKKNGNATYPTVFRISCTPNKKVSVFECNWMETGSPGTSDMASMVSSEAGTDAGKEFLVYLLPPGNQNNVINPFTGQLFGGNFAHCYIYAGDQAANVTIKDTKTNGSIINRTYTIQPNRYVDAFFTLNEWKSIYNGNGNPDSGPDRPYVLIESNQNISVMNSNTNDNWMMYFGSSLESGFSQVGEASQNSAIPGDNITFTSVITNGSSTLTNTELQVVIGSGAVPSSSEVNLGNQNIPGVITSNENQSTITFNNVPNLAANQQVSIVTELVINPTFNNGNPIPNNTVISIESSVTGLVNGQVQQSVITEGIQNNSSNLSQLLFNPCATGVLGDVATDSWNIAWVDYNNDGWEDLFVTDRNPSKPNLLFTNSAGNNFYKATNGPLVNLTEKTVASAWGDYNNDGLVDVFVVNATGTQSRLFKNVNGSYVEVSNTGLDVDPQYFHGAAWFDMDNDGFLDLIVTNYFETKFHKIYRNNKNGTFTSLKDNPIALESNRSTMPALADYNNDGLVDVFIPNGNDKPNSLFKNIGNGNFEKITQSVLSAASQNSVGALWADYNNDGWVDLYVLNASKQQNELFKNLGNGNFEKINNTALTESFADTHTALWIDHDNDGDLDFYMSNDQGSSFYYINNGNDDFTKKLGEMVSSNFGHAMGAASADYNRDGHIDIFVATHSNDKNKLFCNQSNENNHFINIKLVGTYSNKSAIGSTIKITANGQSQYRQVLPVQGLGSQNSLRQHFGLGSATTVATIEIKWPSGYVQILNNIAGDQFVTIIEEAANLVTGFAFSDDNGNCTWEEGEQKIENIAFTIGSNQSTFTSRKDGIFDQRIGAGNHTIALQPNDYWSLNCSSSVNVSGNNNTFNINLPLTKIANGGDAGISFGVTAWRRGFASESILRYYNQGTANATNAKIEVTYPSGIELKSANIPWTERIGDTYIWQIGNINPGTDFTINLRDSVTLAVTVGQFLTLNANIITTNSDLNPANNTFTENLEIVGAIDPNDILVTPRGEGKEGFIKKDQTLKYHIRFQNVGTYAASRIVLENQLSKYLDWNTVKIESVSHEGYHYSIDDKGLLTVRFNNIELPDSTSNEAESHGFFIYTIKANIDVKGGERIENSVLITFDYEESLQSNVVVNTIKYNGKPNTKSLHIFPNPATDLVNVIGDAGDILKDLPLLHTIKILNFAGSVINVINNTEKYNIDINVSHLAPGIYYITGYDYDGLIYQGKMVKM